MKPSKLMLNEGYRMFLDTIRGKDLARKLDKKFIDKKIYIKDTQELVEEIEFFQKNFISKEEAHKERNKVIGNWQKTCRNILRKEEKYYIPKEEVLKLIDKIWNKVRTDKDYKYSNQYLKEFIKELKEKIKNERNKII